MFFLQIGNRGTWRGFCTWEGPSGPCSVSVGNEKILQRGILWRNSHSIPCCWGGKTERYPLISSSRVGGFNVTIQRAWYTFPRVGGCSDWFLTCAWESQKSRSWLKLPVTSRKRAGSDLGWPRPAAAWSRISVPGSEIEVRPWQWEHWILATRLPGTVASDKTLTCQLCRNEFPQRDRK